MGGNVQNNVLLWKKNFPISTFYIDITFAAAACNRIKCKINWGCLVWLFTRFVEHKLTRLSIHLYCVFHHIYHDVFNNKISKLIDCFININQLLVLVKLFFWITLEIVGLFFFLSNFLAFSKNSINLSDDEFYCNHCGSQGSV